VKEKTIEPPRAPRKSKNDLWNSKGFIVLGGLGALGG
jgi:hypothetical protein